MTGSSTPSWGSPDGDGEFGFPSCTSTRSRNFTGRGGAAVILLSLEIAAPTKLVSGGGKGV